MKSTKKTTAPAKPAMKGSGAEKTMKSSSKSAAQEKPQAAQQLKIRGDMTIGDVVAKYPATIEVLLSNGVHCVGCHVQGFRDHGMSDEQVADVIRQLTEAVANDEEPGAAGKEFVVTQKAADKLKSLFKHEKKEDYGLRISIIPGGCSGYSYGLEFDKDSKDNDIVMEEKGVKIMIDKESLKMIKGAKMDFVDSLQGSGFKITNPNASDTCGCGQSFR